MIKEYIVPITEEVSLSSTFILYLLHLKYPLTSCDIIDETIENTYLNNKDMLSILSEEEFEKQLNILTCQEYWKLIIKGEEEQCI